MSCRRNANHYRLSPTPLTSLESSPHDFNVPSTVEGIVEAAVRHSDEFRLNRLAVSEIGRRVDEIRRAKLPAPLFLLAVDVDDDDSAGAALDGSLDDRQAYASRAEDGNRRASLDAGGDHRCAVSRRDAAPQEARLLHGNVVRDGDDGNVRDDGVLAEGGDAHEM